MVLIVGQHTSMDFIVILAMFIAWLIFSNNDDKKC